MVLLIKILIEAPGTALGAVLGNHNCEAKMPFLQKITVDRKDSKEPYCGLVYRAEEVSPSGKKFGRGR